MSLEFLGLESLVAGFRVGGKWICLFSRVGFGGEGEGGDVVHLLLYSSLSFLSFFLSFFLPLYTVVI